MHNDEPGLPRLLVVHLGLPAVAGLPVARRMRAQADVLAERGIAVLPPAAMPRLPARVDAATKGRSPVSWVYSAGALDSSVADIKALSQRAKQRGGTVQAVLVLASVHEIVDALIVRALRQGRTNRDGFPTIKTVNYLPALRRWQDELGDQMRIVVPPAEATTTEIIDAMWEPSGLPGTPPPTPRRGDPVRPRLAPVHAEAMRRANMALSGPEKASLRRTAFRRAMALSREQTSSHTFALPVTDVDELASAMAAEAQTVLATVPDGPRAALFDAGEPCPAIPDSELDGTWARLRADPALSAALPADPSGLVARVDRLRQASRALAHSRGGHDPLASARRAVDLHRLILQDPQVRVVGADDAVVAIPPLCFQYWEPLPPPDYMLKWFASWNDVGVPGGARLVGRDEARAVMDGRRRTRGCPGLRPGEQPGHALRPLPLRDLAGEGRLVRGRRARGDHRDSLGCSGETRTRARRAPGRQVHQQFSRLPGGIASRRQRARRGGRPRHPQSGTR